MQKKEIIDNVNLEGEATEMGKWKEKEKQSFFSICLFLFGQHQDLNAFWASKL